MSFNKLPQDICLLILEDTAEIAPKTLPALSKSCRAFHNAFQVRKSFFLRFYLKNLLAELYIPDTLYQVFIKLARRELGLESYDDDTEKEFSDENTSAEVFITAIQLHRELRRFAWNTCNAFHILENESFRRGEDDEMEDSEFSFRGWFTCTCIFSAYGIEPSLELDDSLTRKHWNSFIRGIPDEDRVDTLFSQSVNKILTKVNGARLLLLQGWSKGSDTAAFEADCEWEYDLRKMPDGSRDTSDVGKWLNNYLVEINELECGVWRMLARLIEGAYVNCEELHMDGEKQDNWPGSKNLIWVWESAERMTEFMEETQPLWKRWDVCSCGQEHVNDDSDWDSNSE